jgi:predicted nucleotidyltransferase
MAHVEPIADPQLAEIVRRLADAYRPERIYLFGSHARGDAGPDSDFDLMVIVADDAPPACQETGLAHEALWGIGTAVDTIVWPRSRFERRLSVPASLPATIRREGKILYAA